MKKSILLMALFTLLYTGLTAQGNNVQKKDPVGKWKFEAPTAPEGYSSGTMIFSLAENKYSAGIMFTNFEYKFPGENVKVVNDSITFIFTLEGTPVNVKLKLEDAVKMSGKAFYPEGTVPVSLTKMPK
jgi:hypothetical protein